MRSTIGRKVTTSLNRPRSRPFSSCIGKRLAEGNPVLSGVHRRFYRRPIDASSPLFSRSTPPPFLPIFPRREKSSPPSCVGPCAREVETKEYWRERRTTSDALERARDDRRRIEQRNRGRLHFSSKRGAREGEGKFLFNSIKLFLCRARRCSNGPVYLLAYRDGKESIKSKLGRDGGGFARDFVTSGRCFIDLNPLTGGTLRGYSPIVFTARDALEISSRPLPPRGEGSTYLRGFMSLPLVVKVS